MIASATGERDTPSAAQISRQLRRVQQEASGGRADVGGGEQLVRTIATVQTAEQLARMQIALPDGRRIQLADVATVSDTVAERRSAALLNGEPVVGFEITRSRGAGEVQVAEGVRRAIDTMRAKHPEIVYTEAFNFVDPVQENYDVVTGDFRAINLERPPFDLPPPTRVIDDAFPANPDCRLGVWEIRGALGS